MFDIFQETGVNPNINKKDRYYFDPNNVKEKDGIRKITIKILTEKWDDIICKTSSNNNQRTSYEILVDVIEDDRDENNNQKGRILTWKEMPLSLMKAMAISMANNNLTQEQVSIKGTLIHLHIDAAKKSRRYNNSTFSFVIIDKETIDEPPEQYSIEDEEQIMTDKDETNKEYASQLLADMKIIKNKIDKDRIITRNKLDYCYCLYQYKDELPDRVIIKATMKLFGKQLSKELISGYSNASVHNNIKDIKEQRYWQNWFSYLNQLL